MRELEETINRSGLWRPDVPHFIDEDGDEDAVEASRSVATANVLTRLW
jgi:hypothetical protein